MELLFVVEMAEQTLAVAAADLLAQFPPALYLGGDLALSCYLCQPQTTLASPQEVPQLWLLGPTRS
jgi:hypothetical protein